MTSHYPLFTRLIVDLYDAGELPLVAALQIEPAFGHALKITYHDGSVRMVRSHVLSTNPHGAVMISNDKGYTSFFLHAAGFVVPRGRVFILPTLAAQIAHNPSQPPITAIAGITSALQYAAEVTGYPCIIKPNDGSQGRSVVFCDTAEDLVATLGRFAADRERLALIEQYVPYPDYRVVIWRGAMRLAYRRTPLTVYGDGVSSVAVLLTTRLAALAAQGRHIAQTCDDPRIVRALARQQLESRSVPGAGQRVVLLNVANMSTGGSAEDVTTQLHPHWGELCTRAAAAIGLVWCGVDLACADIADPAAPYAILELNAAPGLAHFAASSTAARAQVRALIARVIGTLPHTDH